MAFKRFGNRLVVSLEEFSDNGINYVGAKNQLSEEYRWIKEIDDESASTFTNAHTQWLAAAPHIGGKSKGDNSISDSLHHPSDEMLKTIMLEA